MPKAPKKRQPAHVEVVDRLHSACQSAIRPFLPEEDFEGLLRNSRVELVLWTTDLLACVIIPPNEMAGVRRRIQAIRDSLDANEQAKRAFCNEIRFMVSDLDLLLSLLPHEAETPATI